jgi:hypothetical protein
LYPGFGFHNAPDAGATDHFLLGLQYGGLRVYSGGYLPGGAACDLVGQALYEAQHLARAPGTEPPGAGLGTGEFDRVFTQELACPGEDGPPQPVELGLLAISDGLRGDLTGVDLLEVVVHFVQQEARHRRREAGVVQALVDFELDVEA